MRRGHLVLWLAGALAAPAMVGCGKTLTEDDCKKINAKVHDIYQSESQKAAASAEVKSDKAAAVIKTEGDKLDADLMGECKKDSIGKRVDPKEIDCLLGATTIDQLNKCSNAP